MARILPPTYVTPQWATIGTTYPALGKAWDGAATRVAPVLDYLTPETPAPADWHNYLYGVIGDSLLAGKVYAKGLQDAISQMAAQNWRAAYNFPSASDPIQVQCAIWDVGHNAWLAVGVATTFGAGVFWSPDGGETWASVGGNNSGSGHQGPWIDANGNLNAWNVSVGTKTYDLFNWGTLTWSSQTATVGPIWTNNVETVNDGTRIISLGGVTGPGLQLWSSVNPLLSTVWTQGTLPANLAGQTRGALASSSALAIATSREATGANAATYATSGDHGVTWTSRTFSGSVFNTATDKVRALTYSADEGQFLLSVETPGVVNKIWKSADGITWTGAGSIAGTSLVITGLAALGNLWVAASSGTSTEVFHSIDGGTTWRTSEASVGIDATNVTGATYLRSTVIPGRNRILCINGKNARMSFAAG